MGLRGRNNLVNERYFFVTTTVVRFLNLFNSEQACNILIDNIKYYQKKYLFTILAYVIMPSHFHWVVEVNPEFGTISDIMRDLKRNTSRELSELFADNKYYQDVFSSEAEGNKKQYRRVWMKSFDDEVIRNEKMFWNKLLYIHENPVEAGIVLKPEQFKYSSARNYIYGDHSIIEVDVKQGGVILY